MNHNRLGQYFTRGAISAHKGGAQSIAIDARPMMRTMRHLAMLGAMTVATFAICTKAMAADSNVPVPQKKPAQVAAFDLDLPVNTPAKIGEDTTGPNGGKIMSRDENAQQIILQEKLDDGRIIFTHTFKKNTNPCFDPFESNYYDQSCKQERDDYFHNPRWGTEKYDWEKRQAYAEERMKNDWRYAAQMDDRGPRGNWKEVSSSKAGKTVLKSMKYFIERPNGNPNLQRKLEWAEDLPNRTLNWAKGLIPTDEDGEMQGATVFRYVEDAVKNDGGKLMGESPDDDWGELRFKPSADLGDGEVKLELRYKLRF